MKFVALIRGINVGGNRKLPMEDLRGLLIALGYEDVSTYLQSGNAIMSSREQNAAAHAREIEQAIANKFGMSLTVLIRTAEELRTVIEQNPFHLEAVASPAYLHACFLSTHPDASRLSAVDPHRFAPDAFRLGDRVLYLWYPAGSGRSKMNQAFWERQLGVRASSRNWNTVNALYQRL